MKKLFIAFLSLTASLSASAQTKTVTNADLEKFRQQRVESERKLKENYAKMGFPSPEELEKRNAERRAEMEQYSDELREQKILTQNDIITQANTIRAQLVAVDGQINYLRNQGVGSGYNRGFVYSYGVSAYGYTPYGIYRGGRSSRSQISQLPPNMRTVQEYASMYPSSQSIYNQATGNVRFGGGRSNYGKNGYYRRGFIAPLIVGGNYAANDAGGQLLYLEQQRAALLAQYNVIQEQARRAGIRID